MCTSNYLSSGLNSNQYTNSSEFRKTNTTKIQLQNLPVTGGLQYHTLKRANSMPFFPRSKQYESTSSKFYVTCFVARSNVCETSKMEVHY